MTDKPKLNQKQLKVGATVPLTKDDIQQALADWIEKEYGIKANPDAIRIDLACERDECPFVEGAHLDLDREQLKSLINRNDSLVFVQKP